MKTGHLKRRQLGAEKNSFMLPIMHDRPSTMTITMSRVAIVLTVLLWVAYFVSTIIRQFFDGPRTYEFTTQAISYFIVVTFLTFSALMYLMARQGALQRFAKHVRIPRAELENYFFKRRPSMQVIIPSYSEEPDVIRKTILSAALQEYPEIRIALLIDDQPYPTDKTTLDRLNHTRDLAEAITTYLAEPKARFEKAARKLKRMNLRSSASKEMVQQAANEYLWAANWLYARADEEEANDHVDEFFINNILRTLGDDLNLTSEALEASITEKASITSQKIIELYERLQWIFTASISTFERKKYASLSHEANKAMNLNSYIGLMGGSYKLQDTPDGQILIPAKSGKADLELPDSDYLLTLDADSLLLREYCLRLVYFLEQPINQRIAVTQTPYSSFRGAASRIERLAGATTDIQHILHQGMTHYNATFWVGANAVIRKSALEDIKETEWIGGFEIKRYIQDRTVIEDTESSVDLALHNWGLANYPERLSYSATPPDFGSLIIQRRRWANGGLLILPKLMAVRRERKLRNETVTKPELFLRMNYMASIAWGSFGLIFLLAYPYNSLLLSPLVLLAAMPYFLAMASDLKYCGYKRSDIFRIYGFNLILLPVNLAGVLKSIQQALSSKKIPFARTPKVKNRTVSPAIYVVAPLLIIAFSFFTLWRDVLAANWGNAAFAGFNAVIAGWAAVSYIGLRNTFADIWHGLIEWLYIDVRHKSDDDSVSQKELDWQAVLYHGHNNETVPVGAQQYAPATKGVGVHEY